MTIYNNLTRIVKPIIDRFPLIAIVVRFIRDNYQLIKRPQKTPLGFKMIGNQAMQQGLFEPQETIIIKSILKEVDVFIDVGANIGYYCCMALQMDKYTIAFEPVGTNLRYLYKNVKANNWEEKIEIFPLALSDKIGIKEIYGGGTGASLVKGWAGAPSKYGAYIPTTTFDNILGDRFLDKACFVLVDIEGAEMLFLNGAASFLSRTPKPTWMVEISITEHQPEGVSINPNLVSTFHKFWDLGYESWTADRKFRRVSPDDIQCMLKDGENRLGTHNFLFMENGRMQFLMESI